MNMLTIAEGRRHEQPQHCRANDYKRPLCEDTRTRSSLSLAPELLIV
jgi:hypothetical protein